MWWRYVGVGVGVGCEAGQREVLEEVVVALQLMRLHYHLTLFRPPSPLLTLVSVLWEIQVYYLQADLRNQRVIPRDFLYLTHLGSHFRCTVLLR